jgi:hypothetical protein
MCTCSAPLLQSRPDELTSSLTAARDPARNGSEKTCSTGVQATLLFDLGLAGVISRTEMFGDDLVKQLSHASIRATGCLFKVGLGLR